MNLMYNQVTHDIRFEDSPKTTETKKQELIQNFESDNIDKSLIKEIRRSFNDSDSNSSDTPQKIDNKPILSINTSEPSSHIIEFDNSQCVIVTTPKNIEEKKTSPNTNTNTNTNTINYSGKYKNILKENVKKIMSSMSLFKKKTNDDKFSSSSEESVLNDNDNDKVLNNHMILKINSKDETVKEDNIKQMSEQEQDVNKNAIIHKSKSAEEIFMEISKQCNELTVSYTPKNNDIGISLSNVYNDPTNPPSEETPVLERELVIQPSIVDDENNNIDDTMSVITMECIADDNIEQSEQDVNDSIENKIQEDVEEVFKEAVEEAVEEDVIEVVKEVVEEIINIIEEKNNI
jgi:hypothetical protein